MYMYEGKCQVYMYVDDVIVVEEKKTWIHACTLIGMGHW